MEIVFKPKAPCAECGGKYFTKKNNRCVACSSLRRRAATSRAYMRAAIDGAIQEALAGLSEADDTAKKRAFSVTAP